jgi:RNA polymerase sigma-B factor
MSVVAFLTGKQSLDPFNLLLNERLRAYKGADEHNSLLRTTLREQIVTQVMPYVRRLATGLARRNTDPVEDLIQVGNIGLLKAIDKYNPSLGSSFKTYSTYFITGEIRHYLRDKTAIIKAPRQMHELYYRINQLVQELSRELGRIPSDVELAETLHCSVSQINQAQDVERRRLPLSLDQFVTGEGGSSSDTCYIEQLVDHHQLQQADVHESRILLENALKTLKPELRVVVTLTYFEDLSQSEIAEQLAISQMQVSRRLKKALENLSKSTHLKEYQP